MTTKRIVIAVLWAYSCWVMGGVAEFALGVPAILGLAFGVAGAMFFSLDPRGLVWTKSEQDVDKVARPVSADSRPEVGEAPAH